MTQLTLKEIHSALLDVLLDFDEFCKEKGLRYSLAYGTLLGAIRHKGFIPWDDDIDVMMPRGDYEILIREYGTRGRFNCLYNVKGRFLSCYAKIEDTSTVSIEERRKNIYDFGVNIDVFPVDAAPDELELHSEFAHSVNRMRRRIALSQQGFFPISVHVPLLALIEAHTKKTETWIKDCLETMTRYNGKGTSYAGSLCGSAREREIYPKAMFEEYTDVEFEGHMFRSVKDWDAYLKQQFGDYMQLPPENKRRTHGLTVYKK